MIVMDLRTCSMLIAIFAFAFAAPIDSGETSSEENKKIAKECYTKHNLSKEVLEEFRKKPEYPPKSMLCYMKCFLEHKGMLSEDGQINMDYHGGTDGENTGDSNEDSSDSFEYEALAESAEEDLKCLKDLGPIRSCSDMRGVFKCLPIMKKKGNK